MQLLAALPPFHLPPLGLGREAFFLLGDLFAQAQHLALQLLALAVALDQALVFRRQLLGLERDQRPRVLLFVLERAAPLDLLLHGKQGALEVLRLRPRCLLRQLERGAGLRLLLQLPLPVEGHLRCEIALALGAAQLRLQPRCTLVGRVERASELDDLLL